MGADMPRGIWVAALIGLTAFALAIRLADLGRRGIIGYDEAVHLMEARYMLDGGGDTRPGTAHPVHTALLVLGSRIAGWSDRTGLGVSAVCGAATVAVVATIGRTVAGPAAGLLAGTALAVSAYHVRYSRAGLSDAVATLFLSLGAWAALTCRGSSAGWRPAIAAACASLAVLSHYRYVAAAAGVTMLAVWWACRQTRSRKGWAVGAGFAVAGAALPLLFVEAWYAGFRLLHQGHGPHPYLSQLVWRLMEYRGVFTLDDPLAQVRHLVRMDGVFAVGLAAAGALVCARRAFRGDGPAGAVLVWGILPLVFWGLYSGGGIFPRCLVMALPGIALSVGIGGSSLAGMVSRRAHGWRTVVAVLAVGGAAVAAGLPRALAEVRTSGGYRLAAAALAEDAGRRGVPARLHWVYAPVWGFYMIEPARGLGKPLGALLEVVKTTTPPTFYNYAIEDPYVYDLDPGERERLDRLTQKRTPLGAWPNTWANDPEWLGDMALNSRAIRTAGGKRDLARLRVYRWPG